MAAADAAPRRPRIAILGGGAAGCTAALELAAPGWQEHYESITLYQYGFRLGGKGASGRGQFDRIEEHGLHIWLGFYENSFRLLDECYRELDRPRSAPIRTIDQAFERSSLFIVQEPRGDGWLPWFARFPETDDMPGTGDIDDVPSVLELLVRALRLGHTFVTSAASGPDHEPRVEGLHLLPAASGARTAPAITLRPVPTALSRRVGESIRELYLRMWEVVSTTKHLAIAACLTFAEALPGDPDQHTAEQHGLLESLLEQALHWLHADGRHPDDMPDDERRDWYVIEIVMAALRGVIRDGALRHPDGLDVLDQWDFMEWLTRHGAAPEAATCGLVTTLIYDLPFSYRDGRPDQPSIGAGTALRGALHTLLLYRGAVAWKMRAGMGDIVFAPMYEAMVRRGVQVEFFHRVDELVLDERHQRITAIQVSRQVELATDRSSYDPLIDVKGVPSWPAQPLVDQLARPVTTEQLESFWSDLEPAERYTLLDGVDFDEVVLAIPVGAHPYIAGQLIDHVPGWRDMTEQVASIYTQAFQVWLTEEMTTLGCEWPQATTGGYLEPFDTYADMRQLIPRESFPDGAVRSVAYFCNAMETPPGVASPDDRHIPGEAREQVRRASVEFLREAITPLWPRAVRRYPTEFRWEILFDADDRAGEQRFDAQFWRANVDPSERYVLALPGTVQYRMESGRSGVANLVLAGDWTRNGLNSGCVESAVRSGMQAAAAVASRYDRPSHRTIAPVVDRGGRP